MRGIFAQLPADTLTAAMAPVADRCAQLDWAVDLYGGFLRTEDDEEDPELKPFLQEDVDRLPRPWLGRGFLPQYADRLALDEWSYYLGFDSTSHSPAELVRRLGPGWGLQPRPVLFQIIEEWNLLYMLRVDTGWWEAYTPDNDVLDQLLRGWNGRWVDSDQWSNGHPVYPGSIESM
jgi:hypothetical protein